MATDNPLSAFFRGFQGAQQATQQRERQAQIDALNEQLKQVQLLTAQRQFAELNKTPEQRATEQIQAAILGQRISEGGIIPQVAPAMGEAQALTDADMALLESRSIAEELAGIPATREGISRPAQMQTQVAPGFVQSPAAMQAEQKRAFDTMANRTKLTKALEQELKTPQERAMEEEKLAGAKVSTAKSTAILEQINNISSSGGKKTTAVYDPTGTQVIAYQYFDPIKGTTDLIDIKTPKDAEEFKLALDQSNKFDDDAAVKNYSAAISSIRGIQNLASDPKATAADDTALIFAFMKSIDPRSTVREGEQASVQNSAGIPDRMRNIYNNALKGNRLTPTQRLEIFGAAEKSVSGLKTGYDLARTRFIDKSRRSKLDENIVVGPALDHKAIMREFQNKGATPTVGAAPQAANLPSVSTQEQFNALAPEAQYIGEDGRIYRKPKI